MKPPCNHNETRDPSSPKKQIWSSALVAPWRGAPDSGTRTCRRSTMGRRTGAASAQPAEVPEAHDGAWGSP